LLLDTFFTQPCELTAMLSTTAFIPLIVIIEIHAYEDQQLPNLFLPNRPALNLSRHLSMLAWRDMTAKTFS
jgi:hypothetical protein